MDTLLSGLDPCCPLSYGNPCEVGEKEQEGDLEEPRARLALQGLLRTQASQIPGPGFIFSRMRGPEGNRGM